jgi:hypothetical protein
MQVTIMKQENVSIRMMQILKHTMFIIYLSGFLEDYLDVTQLHQLTVPWSLKELGDRIIFVSAEFSCTMLCIHKTGPSAQLPVLQVTL